MAPREFYSDQEVTRSYERVTNDVQRYRNLGGTALKAVEFGNAIFEMRDYQSDVWSALRQAREDGKDSALIHLATGLGKTTVGVVDALDFAVDFYEREGRPPKIMFAVHQSEILNQAAARFNEFAPSLSQGLYAAGQKSTNHPLTFATMQSLAQNLGNLDPNEFDYILYDEAHHAQAETYSEVIRYFKPEFKLALTATPDRMDDEDIRELFGEEIYSKPLSEAMAEGHLVDVNYHIIFDDAVKRAMEEGFTPQTLAEIRELLKNESRNEQIVAQIQAEKQRLGVENAKTIVFCQDIEQADEMAELLGGKPYHSGINGEREQTLQAFRDGEFQTITTRDMFNEGVDIPDAQLLIFLRSTSSRTVFEQQLGRGLRKHPGKESVVILDFVANIERLTQVKGLTDSIARHQSERGEKSSADTQDNGLKVHTEHTEFDFDKISLNLMEKYLEIRQRPERPEVSSMEEAAQLWLTIAPDARPTAESIAQKSKEGIFVSMTTIDKLGTLRELQIILGCERPIITDMDTAAEVWLEIAPNEKPTMRRIAEMSRENQFCSGDIINQLGGIEELLATLGYEVRLSFNDIAEAANYWQANWPDEKPTKQSVTQKSKEGLYISYGSIQKLGSLPEFRRMLGYDNAVIESIEDAANIWRQNWPDEKPTKESIAAKNKRGEYISVGGVEKLGGVRELQGLMGYDMRKNINSIEQVADVWRQNWLDEKPTIRAIGEKSKSKEFVSVAHIESLGGIARLQEELGYEVRGRVDISTMEEAVDFWRKNWPDEIPTHGLIGKKSKQGLFISASKVTYLGGVDTLCSLLGYASRPEFESIEDAADAWIAMHPEGTLPSNTLLRDLSKQRLFSSMSVITSLGGVRLLRDVVSRRSG